MTTQTYGDVETVPIEALMTQVAQAQQVIAAPKKQQDFERVDNPANYGERNELMTLAGRYQTTLPSCSGFSINDCYMLAQIAYKMGLNPYFGEVYAFKNTTSQKIGNEWVKTDKMQIVLGYKALVRWCKRVSDYDATYHVFSKDEIEAEGAENGSIVARCDVIRHDSRERMQFLVNMRLPVREAMQQVTTSSIGVVTRDDMFKRDGSPVAPPKGWTWLKTAKKRALKNALMLAYSLPSLDELDSGVFNIGYDAYDEDFEDPFEAQENAAKQIEVMTKEERLEKRHERINMLRGEIEDGID